MNSYQKATLLVSFTFLPLVLLFLKGMNVSGIGIVGLAWLAGTAALMYALRLANARAPQRFDRSGYAIAPRLHASPRHRGFGSRSQR